VRRWGRWSLLFLLWVPSLGLAQQSAAPDTSAAQSPLQRLMAARAGGPPVGTTQVRTMPTGPFFVSLKNTPKAGTRSSVQRNMFYSDLTTNLTMRSAMLFTNKAKWSYEEYRKQDKKVERRGENFSYNLGQSVPFVLRLDGDWSWSQDRTVNTAGFANLFAQNNKSLRLAGSKSQFHTGPLVNSLKFGASLDDRLSENQGTANNSQDGKLDAGFQSGWSIRPGLVIAGRVYGTAGAGSKTLAAKDSPSTANGDTLAIGVYYDQTFATGRVAISRASFQKKYLDFKKNANGLIDTVGIAEDLKVIDELETRDAVNVEFATKFHLGRISFDGAANRTTSNLDYAVNGLGLKQRQLDTVTLASGTTIGVDSLQATYDYSWKWDDQRLQGATSNRGRQYTKTRGLELVWQRPLFAATTLRVRYFENINQDIAQNQHNQNDKDRLQKDFSVALSRVWPKVFRTKMVYTFRGVQDLAIRDTRSSNNNLKDTYEINPGYIWYVAPWLTWDQNYRVFIQYTDYVFSDLESVTREDNYNKRGNLTTKVTIYPTRRLKLVLSHDYNKKFNATKAGVSATGSAFYDRDLNQTIDKLDLGLTFDVVRGVTLEAATYRTRDDRMRFGRVTSETTDHSGEIWVGAKVNQTWQRRVTLSALVKKYNAYGPSVTESSSNYWESDVWLKWEF